MNKITNKSIVEKELSKEFPNSFWCWASVEQIDTEGDIIRIDGISWDKYHRPEDKKWLKVYPNHTKDLVSGKPAVIGVVKDIQKGIKDGIPALKMLIELAVGADGKLVELAEIYKNYIFSEQNLVDSVSIGIIIDDKRSIPSGRDITQSQLYEVSLTALPANCNADIKKKLKSLINFGEKTVDPKSIIELKLEQITKSIEQINSKIDIILENMNITEDEDTSEMKKLNEKIDKILNH